MAGFRVEGLGLMRNRESVREVYGMVKGDVLCLMGRRRSLGNNVVAVG